MHDHIKHDILGMIENCLLEMSSRDSKQLVLLISLKD